MTDLEKALDDVTAKVNALIAQRDLYAQALCTIIVNNKFKSPPEEILKWCEAEVRPILERDGYIARIEE